MQRRRFLVSSGIALGGALGTAGCFGGAGQTPPRESAVFDTIDVRPEEITVTLENPPVVQSRKVINTAIEKPSTGGLAATLADLSPVGLARGAEGTTRSDPRGTGAAASAPRGRNGHAKWRGGEYTDWWDRHGSQVNEYNVAARSAGFYYYGTTEDFRQQLPGPRPLEWDQPFNDVENQQFTWGIDVREGWYRVGVELEKNEKSLGWESIDFEVRPVNDTATATTTDETTPAGGSGNVTGTDNETETASGDDQQEFEIVTQWKVSGFL